MPLSFCAVPLLARSHMSQVVVTIHGTGRTAQDFEVPQMQALAAHLGTVPQHRPVWWGDLIDAGACVSHNGEWLIARLHALAQRFIGRPALYTTRLVGHLANGLHGWIDGVAGVVAYFVSARQREVIRERLRAVLAELSRHNHEIILISESLGCLIAFDVLRTGAQHYNIAAWFTLGCPLWLLVRTGQRRADLGAINRQTVGQWFNLYAPRDLVAAPMAPVFPAYPIRDERIDGAHGRLHAHRYWQHPRVAALIARVLR